MRSIVLLFPIALMACATSGSSGALLVDAISQGQPLAAANCVVANNNATWNVIVPATINIGSVAGDLRVVCSKPGYRTSEVLYAPYKTVNSSLGVGVGGGNVGIGLNIPVGLSTGNYPSRITVDMNPQ